MVRVKHRVIIILATLCMVSSTEDSKYQINNKKIRDTFNKLLSRVTSANEERFNAIKNYNDLLDYPPKVNLRTRDGIVAVIIPNKAQLTYDTDETHLDENIARVAARFPKSEDKDDDDEDKDSDEGEDKDSDDGEVNDGEDKVTDLKDLRAWSGCSKKAAKYCRKACKKSFKEVCYDYKCSSSMKRKQKKECKIACNSEFEHYDSDY